MTAPGSEALPTEMTEAERLYQRALECAREGDSLEAVRLWRESVHLDPGHAEALANLGWYEQSNGRPWAAIPYYRRALAARPDWEELLANLVDCYRLVRNWTAAEETAARGLEIHPDSVSIQAARRCARRESRFPRAARWVVSVPVVSAVVTCAAAVWHRMVSAVTSPAGGLLEWAQYRRGGGYTEAEPKETRFRLSRYSAREHRRVGWAKSIALGYPRAVEYQLVTEAMGPLCGSSVLDIGGGGSAISLDWTALGAHVTSIDPGEIVGRLREHSAYRDLPPMERPDLVQCDGVFLPFAGGSFDVVVSISTLEHIPGDGDTRAMCEAARVVRPGGRVIVTVEAGREYLESWVDVPVVGVQYESVGENDRRLSDAGVGLFVRTYTLETARRRLLEPSGLREIDGGVFGDVVFRGRDWLEGTACPWARILFREAIYLATQLSYRRLPSGETPPPGATVFLVMEKVGGSSPSIGKG